MPHNAGDSGDPMVIRGAVGLPESSSRHLEVLQSKGVKYDGGDVFSPYAYFSGSPCPPFAAEHALLLRFLLQIDCGNRVRLDTISLSVELQGDAPVKNCGLAMELKNPAKSWLRHWSGSAGEQHICSILRQPSAYEATSSASQRSALFTDSRNTCQRTWQPLHYGPLRAHCNSEATYTQMLPAPTGTVYGPCRIPQPAPDLRACLHLRVHQSHHPVSSA